MSLANYGDLQTAILAHLGRPGDLAIPTADLVTMAEAEFNRVLRTQNQVTFSDIITVGSQQEYPLPANVNTIFEVLNTSSEPRVVLEQMPPSFFDSSYPFATTGQPANYTMIGNNILFGPIPSGPFTIRLRYYANIPALSIQNPVNWLLTQHPDAYLFQCLRHAHTFLGADTTDLETYEKRAAMAIVGIKQLDIRNKAGGAPLRMRTSIRPRDSVFPR